MKKFVIFWCAFIFVSNVSYPLHVQGQEMDMETNAFVIPEGNQSMNEQSLTTLSVNKDVLTYDDVVYDGPYTFYLNRDGTIKYAGYDETGLIERYYTYYGDVRIEDDYWNRVHYVFYVDERERITYAEERAPASGEIVRYYRYHTGTVFGDNYDRHIDSVFEVNAQGVVTYGEGRADVTGEVNRYYQFHTGARFSPEIEKFVRYAAYVNKDQTIHHVREYKNGYWILGFEFPPKTKINHKQPYWYGRTHTFYLTPKTKDGSLDRAAYFGVPFATTNVAQALYRYHAGTKYLQNHGARIRLRAALRPNQIIDHVREYDAQGNWIKVFAFPANTKVDHSKWYWGQRTYTFYMKPNRKDGLIDYTILWNAPDGTKAARKYFYQPDTYYGKNHGGRITKVINY